MIGRLRSSAQEIAQKGLSQLARRPDTEPIQRQIQAADSFLASVVERSESPVLQQLQALSQVPELSSKSAFAAMTMALQLAAEGTGGAAGGVLARAALELREKAPHDQDREQIGEHILGALSRMTQGGDSAVARAAGVVSHRLQGNHVVTVLQGDALSLLADGAPADPSQAVARLGERFNSHTHLGTSNYINTNHVLLSEMNRYAPVDARGVEPDGGELGWMSHEEMQKQMEDTLQRQRRLFPSGE